MSTPMAGLSALEANTISKLGAACKDALGLQATLTQLNIICNSSGGVASTISQPNLDATPSLSGLTVQEFLDANAALNATILASLNTMVTQLTQLAART